MIPTKTDIDIKGFLPGEDVQMTLDSSGAAHLMSVLTNLYSDKTKAIVREYSTNALDSHIQAGVDRPIEVNTPSDFKPFFSVQDFGIGMDAEDIRNIYSRYGASTKRNSNAQNGMLGLGSKSALTYTTQFKVTGVKNGVKTYVVVSRSIDGSGVMKIISQSQTNEVNGVTIDIPVTDRREIERVAKEFFQFWKPGTVLLNGEDPTKTDGVQIGKFLLSTEITEDKIVMGNVAYPVPSENRIFGNYYGRVGVVVNVDMGEINFTPSRESLHMTELTKKTIQSLRKEFDSEARKYVVQQINNAATHAEAIKNYHDILKSNLGDYVRGVKYRGVSFPHSFNFKHVYSPHTNTAYNGNHVEASRMFNANCVVVVGYDKEKIHSTHRTKIKKWLENNGIRKIDHVYWAKEMPGLPWLADVKTVNWDDVSSIKLERISVAQGTKTTFDMIDGRGYRVRDISVDKNKTIVYGSPMAFVSDEARELVARFLTNDSKVQVVLVNKNKWKNFVKEFPKAIHIDIKVNEIISEYLKNLSEPEKIYLRSDWKDRSFCAKLDEAKIDDPVIKTAIKNLSVDGLSFATENKYQLMQQVAKHWNISFPNLTAKTNDRLFSEYPLIDVYGHRNLNELPRDHVYLYINACYKDKTNNLRN